MISLSPLEYGRLACETVMKRYLPSQLPPYDKDENCCLFTYHQGVFLSGMNRIYLKTGEEIYFEYIKDWVHATLDGSGNVREHGGWVSLDTLDFRQPGILLFPLYEKTGDTKYLENIRFLVESLKEFPTNSQGGFWHMKNQPYQMWLDSLYMVGPLMAMYAAKFNRTEFLEKAINQVLLMYNNMLDAGSGLLVHGWDESKSAEWANPRTGLSAEVWGRSMGWYVTALADILDYVPDDHPSRFKMIEIEKSLLERIAQYQDIKTGRWFQVVDKANQPGNWLENSCSCLFVYALSKAINHGYIDRKYHDVAKKGFWGVIDSLKYDDNGGLVIGDICVGTCIDKGDYAHYIGRSTGTNDLHGCGAFVLMCSEYEE